MVVVPLHDSELASLSGKIAMWKYRELPTQLTAKPPVATTLRMSRLVKAQKEEVHKLTRERTSHSQEEVYSV